MYFILALSVTLAACNSYQPELSVTLAACSSDQSELSGVHITVVFKF